jgi:hypothetical protein
MASKNQGHFNQFVRHKDICPLLKKFRPVWKKTISDGRCFAPPGGDMKIYVHAYPNSFREDMLTFLKRRAGVENPEMEIPASEEEESEASRNNAERVITSFERTMSLLLDQRRGLNHRSGSQKSTEECYLGHLFK